MKLLIFCYTGKQRWPRTKGQQAILMKTSHRNEDNTLRRVTFEFFGSDERLLLIQYYSMNDCAKAGNIPQENDVTVQT